MENNLSNSRQIAQYLLEIKAVVLQPTSPFTWASGWKSPIYCDNRLILSYPTIRTFVQNAFVELIENKYKEAKHISGVATGGIAQAALIADQMNLPMSYIRSGKKGHGRQNQVEGKINANEPIVVIEDLISTGGSSLQAIDALKDNNANVAGLVAIFSYGFQIAVDAFDKAQIPFYTLTDYNTLIDVALELEYIDVDSKKTLDEWRLSPSTWLP